MLGPEDHQGGDHLLPRVRVDGAGPDHRRGREQAYHARPLQQPEGGELLLQSRDRHLGNLIERCLEQGTVVCPGLRRQQRGVDDEAHLLGAWRREGDLVQLLCDGPGAGVDEPELVSAALVLQHPTVVEDLPVEGVARAAGDEGLGTQGVGVQGRLEAMAASDVAPFVAGAVGRRVPRW